MSYTSLNMLLLQFLLGFLLLKTYAEMAEKCQVKNLVFFIFTGACNHEYEFCKVMNRCTCN